MTAPKVSWEKVTASMTLPLPSGVEPKVKKNEKVKGGEVIAKRKAASLAKSYHLSKLIDVSPQKTLDCLTKELGEEVSEGELVARKKSLLGKKEEFVAPISGVLDSLTEDGILRIRHEVKAKEVKAPFSGVVGKTADNAVNLTFAALEIKGSWGRGEKKTGYLMIFEEEEDDLLTLNGSCKEQIIVLRGKLPRGLWYKAVSLGVAGFAAGSLADKSLIKEVEEEEDLPVILLADDEKIKAEIWQELVKARGKMVLLDGKEKRLLIPL